MKYCCFCGKELILKTLLDGSTEKYCPICDYVFFDTPSPAIIAAVTNGGKVLLTRSVSWSHPYWGLISGHVKSSETAEEAAVREIREEVGLEISNLKILGTYLRGDKHHNLLMIGFTAETNSVNIKESKELEKSSWFKIDEPLPLRPNSIAAQVVKHVFPDMRSIKPEEGSR